MEWSHLNPPDLPDWSTFFSQVVCVEAYGTRQVFVAGQVGVVQSAVGSVVTQWTKPRDCYVYAKVRGET